MKTNYRTPGAKAPEPETKKQQDAILYLKNMELRLDLHPGGEIPKITVPFLNKRSKYKL